jgi:hypothetical protein
MTNHNLLPAALIIASMIATPAIACASHVTSRHHARDVDARASPTVSNNHDRVGISAPGVNAFRPPPDGDNCDVGDNPRVC